MLTASLQENEYQGVIKAKVSVENMPVQSKGRGSSDIDELRGDRQGRCG